MNPSTKHHYIPVFHINKWINPHSNQFWIYKNDGPGPITEYYKRSGKAVGYQDNLYSLESELFGAETVASDMVEEKFKRIDDDAAKVMKKMNDGNLHKLSQEERIAWSKYVHSLIVRNPDSIANLDFHAKESARLAAEKFTNLETLKRINAMGVANNQARIAAVTLTNDDAWSNGLSIFQWGIVPAKPNCHYILTESPVWTIDSENGIAFLALPISPKKLWITIPSGDSPADKEELLNLANVAYNVEKVMSARKFIISDSRLNDDGPINYTNAKKHFKSQFSDSQQETT